MDKSQYRQVPQKASDDNAPLQKSPTDVTLEELDLDLGDVSHRRTKYGRKQSTPWKTLKPFRPKSRDGKIPINEAGLFSFLFMSWMSPLIWRMFRKRKQDLEEGDIWQCSDLETCLPNTQRLTRIWADELKKYGAQKASFFRVWLKFSLTRTLLTLIFVAINAVSTFLESGYLLNLVISYLEEPGFDLGYGLTLVAIIAVCQIIRATSFCLIIMLGIQTGVRFRAGYLGIAYNKVLRLKNLKGKALSEMVTLFGADAYRVYLNCVTFVYLLSLPVYMIIGVVYTYHLLGPWCFIAMGVFIFCYLIQAYLTNIVSSLRAKTLVYTDRRVRKVTEVLNSMKLIKMYAWEQSFRDAIHAIRKVERKFLFIASLVQSIMTAVIPVTPTLATVATLGAYKGFGNDIKASTAFAVVGTLNFLRIIVAFIPFATRMIGECRVSFRRMEKLLLMDEYQAPDSNVEDPENAVEVEGATFIWDPSDPLDVTKDKKKKKEKKDMKSVESATSLQLQGLNLTVKKGKLIGICGSVGGGKSSLMSAILGRMPMVTGRLAVSGTVAYAAQQAWIFNATLRENILFGKPYDPDWYQEVLSVCGLEPDLTVLANGDETEIGDRGINLSGGQKQRVSLARAVYSKSDIYLLDDVLSAVDVHVGQLLFHKCIRKTLGGRTVILVTHQLQYLKHCNEILVVEKGAIVERGNHDTLMTLNGHYGSMIRKFHTETNPREGLANAQIPNKSNEADQGSTETTTTTTTTAATNGHAVNGTVKVPEKGKLHKPEDKAAKGKLTSAEEVGIGDIKCGTYKSYVSAAGGYVIAFICLFWYILTFGCVVFSEFWLSRWIETFEGMPRGGAMSNSSSPDNGSTVIPYGVQTGATNSALMGSNFSMDIPTTASYLNDTTTPAPGGEGVFDIYLIVYVSSVGFIILATITRGLIGAATYIRASSNLHDRVLANVMRAPMRFFDANPSGRILNRFSKDQDEADVFIPQFLDSFLQLACTIVLSLGTALYSVPWIGIAIVPVGIVYALFKMVSTVSVRQFKRLENVARSPLLNHMSTSANGLSTIVTFQQQRHFIVTNQQYTDTSSVATFMFDGSMRWIGLRLELTSAVIALATALVLVLTKGSIDPAIAGLAYTMCVRVVGIMQFSIRVMNEVEARFTSIERLHQYEKKLEAEPDTYEIAPPDNWPHDGRVIFSNVEMKYRDDMDPVLRSIRFDIHPRQKVGIVGRTGAGKSSLAVAMFRLNELSGGHVYIDEIDVSKISLHLLRSKLSTIPQDPVLFAGTMRYNLDPFDQYTDEDIWSALEHVHMKDKVKEFGSQLEFLIEENGENFSVGERQLICLARAILRRNKVLLLDEATANIDTQTDAKIQQTIKESFADCTVLTIAHRLNTVLHCDQIIILDAGKVMEMGSPQDLLSDPHSFFNSMMAAQTVKTPVST